MIRVAIDSAECKTPSQRLRFLRLSKSPGGGKLPIGVEEMARIAQIGHSTLARIESGDQTVPAKCVEKLCAALKIPLDMLGWSDKKWERVVSNIGLAATEFRKTES
jgi:transcriptional regulator with XRE-family HTH domain